MQHYTIALPRPKYWVGDIIRIHRKMCPSDAVNWLITGIKLSAVWEENTPNEYSVPEAARSTAVYRVHALEGSIVGGAHGRKIMPVGASRWVACAAFDEDEACSKIGEAPERVATFRAQFPEAHYADIWNIWKEDHLCE